LKNPIASKFSFYEILNSTNQSDLNILNLKYKCIETGFYYTQLERWLLEFQRDELYIIDSDSFIKTPVHHLNDVQNFFKLTTFSNYDEIVYLNSNNSNVCLKNSIECFNFLKYPQIDSNAYEFLREVYAESNKNLKSLFEEYQIDIPAWL
jgi:hypothetical protein